MLFLKRTFWIFVVEKFAEIFENKTKTKTKINKKTERETEKCFAEQLPAGYFFYYISAEYLESQIFLE
jgi:hypothetical protein